MLDTRKRVSTPRMLLLSDVSCSPSASLAEDPLPPLFLQVSQKACFSRGTMTRQCYYNFLTQSIICSGGVLFATVSRHPFAVLRHEADAQPCLEMTGVALIGRRWADRQCRDRTIARAPPIQHLSMLRK